MITVYGFERLIALAKKTGIAVGIGHPHPETLKYLEKTLPTLAQRGVKLILASQALKPVNCDHEKIYCSTEIVMANLENDLPTEN